MFQFHTPFLQHQYAQGHLFTQICDPCRSDAAAAGASSNGAHRAAAGDELDLERWQRFGLPVPLIAACTACEMGVKRAHLARCRTVKPCECHIE